jgi:hypothetical protein
MAYNGKPVFDEVSETFVHPHIDEGELSEIFGEEESLAEQFSALSERIASETQGMSYDEAYRYYEENLGEGVWDILKTGAGWVADKVFGGGGGGSTTNTSTNTASNASTSSSNTTNTVSPNFHTHIDLAPVMQQMAAQRQTTAASSSSASRASSQPRTQVANQFNPQFNPYLQQWMMQQGVMPPGYGYPPAVPYPQPQPQYPQPQQQAPCNCPPAGQIPAIPQVNPQNNPQNTQNNTINQLGSLMQNPQAMSMLNNMLTANLTAAQAGRSARESIESDYLEDEDMAEILPIIGAVASALAPTLIQAAPSIIQGAGKMIGGFFNKRRQRGGQRRQAQQRPNPYRQRYPQAPQQVPQGFAPPQGPAPLQQQQVAPAPGAQGQDSGILGSLMGLLQNPQITSALGNLLQSGVSQLVPVGANATPVSEAAMLNAISEYARLAAEELESAGYGDNLTYMKDDAGQWKYDPSISTYRAEAFVEALN